MHKKTILALSLYSVFAMANPEPRFTAIIEVENAVAQKVGVVEKNITAWQNVGSEYDCTSWSPNVNTIDLGIVFEQSQDCSQDQSRTKDIYTVYNTGSEIYEKTETEYKTITETNKQNAVGTKNFKDTEKADPWSEWIDNAGHYNCDTWTPAPSTINYGDSFTQKRDCDQNQIRSRDVYDVWADGSETFNRTETETKVVDAEESQSAIGTKNYVVSTSTSTGSWSNSGGHYNCSSWTPPQSNYYTDQRFTQKRTCSQNQVATETTYNNWADGTQTIDSTTQKSKVVSEEESRQVYGTKSRKNWTLYQQSAMIYYEQYNAGSIFTYNGYNYNKTTSQPSGSCSSSTGLYYRRHNGMNYNMYYVDLYRCQ